MMDKAKRARMAGEIIDAMRKHYEEHGEEGDFEDGERWFNDHATDDEIQAEHDAWCHGKVPPL